MKFTLIDSSGIIGGGGHLGSVTLTSATPVGVLGSSSPLQFSLLLFLVSHSSLIGTPHSSHPQLLLPTSQIQLALS